MKNSLNHLHIKVIFTCFLLLPIIGTAQINYGSNNGSYLTIRNTKIYYETYGTGAPLILLHGGLGSIADFRKCIPELSKKYKLIIPDAPGLGRSEHADSVMTYPLMAIYYSKMIDILKLDSAYVMGWSDGGIAALLLGKNRPDKIKKIISVGPNYRADGMVKEEIAFTKDSFCNIDWFETHMKGWIDNYKKISPQGNWKRYISEAKNMWLQEQYFPKSDLGTIQAPTLIVLGDHDLYTLEHGIDMYHALPKGQFCVLPATTHYVFSEQPNLIDQITINFLTNKK